MRLVTFEHQGQARCGAQVRRENENFILDLGAPDDIFLLCYARASVLGLVHEALAKGEQLIPESAATLLAPIPRPGKILCVGHNYKGHIGIGKTDLPEYPNFFCKTANTIIGSNQPIRIPRVTRQVDYEAELAVVIGRRGRDIAEAEAMDHVAGYSIFNDVSARDYQKRTSQWLLGKSFDTFGPLGPALVTADEVPDPHSLDLQLTVNGEPKQRANTRDLIFSVPFLVSYLSQVLTLEPGDIIATGTPAKLHPSEAPESQRFLNAGDVVEITIERVGTLRNTVEI